MMGRVGGWLIVALVALGPLGLVTAVNGCVSVNPDRAPQLQWEGRVAARGIEVQNGAQAILDAADAANQAGALSDDDLRRVAEIGLILGREGARLSAVLRAVDTDRDPISQARGLGRATAIVDTFSGLLGDLPPLPESVQVAVVALQATLTVLSTELS